MKPTSHARQRGTQIAELALVLPLLAFLALVVTEGAAFIRVHQVLNNSAREGARISADQAMKPGPGCNNPDAGIQATVLAGVQADICQYACDNGVNITAASAACAAVTCPANAKTLANPSITLNQCNSVTTGAGLHPWASSVVVKGDYGLTYLPRITNIFPSGSITLQGSAEFLDFY